MFRTSPKESILSGIHFRLAKEQFSESLSLKLIVEIPQGKYVYSTIFVVVDESRSTKHRLIFNMKPLNENLASKSFTMVNQTDVIEMVKDFSYAGVVDISKAYFHIGIHRDYQKYFVFAFNGKIYKFLVMPFGLSTTPYLFTKFSSPICEFLRSKFKIPIVSYIDDILILNNNNVGYPHGRLVLQSSSNKCLCKCILCTQYFRPPHQRSPVLSILCTSL